MGTVFYNDHPGVDFWKREDSEEAADYDAILDAYYRDEEWCEILPEPGEDGGSGSGKTEVALTASVLGEFLAKHTSASISAKSNHTLLRSLMDFLDEYEKR